MARFANGSYRLSHLEHRSITTRTGNTLRASSAGLIRRPSNCRTAVIGVAADQSLLDDFKRSSFRHLRVKRGHDQLVQATGCSLRSLPRLTGNILLAQGALDDRQSSVAGMLARKRCSNRSIKPIAPRKRSSPASNSRLIGAKRLGSKCPHVLRHYLLDDFRHRLWR